MYQEVVPRSFAVNVSFRVSSVEHEVLRKCRSESFVVDFKLIETGFALLPRRVLLGSVLRQLMQREVDILANSPAAPFRRPLHDPPKMLNPPYIQA